MNKDDRPATQDQNTLDDGQSGNRNEPANDQIGDTTIGGEASGDAGGFADQGE